jgi:hypothetical protein
MAERDGTREAGGWFRLYNGCAGHRHCNKHRAAGAGAASSLITQTAYAMDAARLIKGKNPHSLVESKTCAAGTLLRWLLGRGEPCRSSSGHALAAIQLVTLWGAV